MDIRRVEEYMKLVEESQTRTFPFTGKLKVGVDLGTAYIVLVVLDEENHPVACEKQAASVLRDGVVVDYSGALRIVRELKEKLEARIGQELVNCAIAMPAGTESSVKTHQYVAEGAGFEVTAVLDEPSSANAVYQIQDGVIVDIGGGTTDIAVISLGGTVVSTSIKIAGDDFDEAIVRYMRKKHNLLIGERTAEDIKIKVGSCYPRAQADSIDVRGRNLVTGLPKTVTVTSEETEEALKEATAQIVEAVHSVLERTPPELTADIADRGIVLTGGGALLRGLEELLESKTGINTMTAEEPMQCVAIGTGKFVEFLSGGHHEE